MWKVHPILVITERETADGDGAQFEVELIKNIIEEPRASKRLSRFATPVRVLDPDMTTHACKQRTHDSRTRKSSTPPAKSRNQRFHLGIRANMRESEKGWVKWHKAILHELTILVTRDVVVRPGSDGSLGFRSTPLSRFRLLGMEGTVMEVADIVVVARDVILSGFFRQPGGAAAGAVEGAVARALVEGAAAGASVEGTGAGAVERAGAGALVEGNNFL